jgi:anti-sigma factor RsiW
MTSCLRFEERLNDYLDEILTSRQHEEVEQHLEECAGCRAELSALRSLRKRADNLPRSLEPARDLWPAIRSSLPPRRGGVSARFPSFSGWAWGARPLGLSFGGAVALALIAFAGVVALRRTSAPIPPPRPAAASGPSAALASVRRVEAEYGNAAERLEAALGERKAGRSPELRILEENLRIVERAIRQVHRAAAVDPGHSVDEHAFARLYRTKFELLQQAARLSSREGEEKRS